MYRKQEAALIKKKFWTTFGQYMKPVANAEGETINWVNYKTGIRHIYFRMDVTNKEASIGIELKEEDTALRYHQCNTLLQLRSIFKEELQEEWEWKKDMIDEDGNTISRVSIFLPDVSIFKEEDWPAIISFFKPRIISLDRFWYIAKDSLQ